MKLEDYYKKKILKKDDLILFFEEEESDNKTHPVNILIRHQIKHWPLLASAYEDLKRIKSKTIMVGKSWFEVNYNPLRKVNVTAKVDRKTIESKNCFLCPHYLYDEQKGVMLEDFLVIVNPRPVAFNHLTIIGKHQRQHINSNVVSQMLKLAEKIHPFRLLYNAPGTGASIPNHFHFQAISIELPIENPHLNIMETVASQDGLNVYVPEFPSRVLVVEGNNPEKITNIISQILVEMERIGCVDKEWGEHMINIWVSYSQKKDSYRVFVIPRSKHRPHGFGEGKDEIAVSPATLEMCGKFIVINQATFDKCDQHLIKKVLDEVCLPEEDFNKLSRNISQ